MEPVRTLKLAQGAVIGADELTVEEFNARVRERYPKAARLPERPYLDDLLKDAGLDFEWNPGARDGTGAYINKLREQIRSSTGSSSLTRYRTATVPAEESLQAQSALEFEERLERAIRTGAFLAIAVGTAKMLKAEDEITRRFDVRRISIDQLLIREMRAAAEEANAKWPVVLRADRSERDSGDWRKLVALVKRAMPTVKAAIEEAGREHTVLVTRLGLLARYDQLDLFNWMRERVGARDGIRGAWALIACDNATMLPVLDGHPVPVFTAAQWAGIPDDWIRNLHRSDTSATLETADSRQRQG